MTTALSGDKKPIAGSAPADSVAVPLCVDLDDTLVRTNVGTESFFAVLAKRKLGSLLAPGRAPLKQRLAELADLGPGAAALQRGASGLPARAESQGAAPRARDGRRFPHGARSGAASWAVRRGHRVRSHAQSGRKGQGGRAGRALRRQGLCLRRQPPPRSARLAGGAQQRPGQPVARGPRGSGEGRTRRSRIPRPVVDVRGQP